MGLQLLSHIKSPKPPCFLFQDVWVDHCATIPDAQRRQERKNWKRTAKYAAMLDSPRQYRDFRQKNDVLTMGIPWDCLDPQQDPKTETKEQYEYWKNYIKNKIMDKIKFNVLKRGRDLIIPAVDDDIARSHSQIYSKIISLQPGAVNDEDAPLSINHRFGQHLVKKNKFNEYTTQRLKYLENCFNILENDQNLVKQVPKIIGSGIEGYYQEHFRMFDVFHGVEHIKSMIENKITNSKRYIQCLIHDGEFEAFEKAMEEQINDASNPVIVSSTSSNNDNNQNDQDYNMQEDENEVQEEKEVVQTEQDVVETSKGESERDDNDQQDVQMESHQQQQKDIDTIIIDDESHGLFIVIPIKNR